MDYAIGASLFLLVLVGVFMFLPSVFAPFSGDGGASLVVADRTATKLAGETLTASAARPTVLSTACTTAFFDATGSAPPDCNYDADASELSAALGFNDRRRQVNVTVTNESGRRTLNGTDLRAGPAVPTTGDVVTATRIVLLDGEQNRLRVRVW